MLYKEDLQECKINWALMIFWKWNEVNVNFLYYTESRMKDEKKILNTQIKMQILYSNLYKYEIKNKFTYQYK